MRPDEILLGLELLDRQVVDRDGVNCGKVDDVELAASAEGNARVVAILIGPAAWRERLGGLTGALVGAWLRILPGRGGPVRVAAGDLVDVSSAVVLAHTRADYRLDEADRRLHRLFRLLPGHRS